MKKLYLIIFFCLALAACASIHHETPEEFAKRQAENYCNNIASVISENYQKNYNSCMYNKPEFQKVLSLYIKKKATNLEVCKLNNLSPQNSITTSVIKNKKINCPKVFEKEEIREAEIKIDTMSNLQLCHIWNERSGIPQGAFPKADKTVKQRSLNCPAILSLELQQQQITAYQQAQQEALEESRRQARAQMWANLSNQLQQQQYQQQQQMYQQQMLNRLNQPKYTNCNSFGRTVNCTTY